MEDEDFVLEFEDRKTPVLEMGQPTEDGKIEFVVKDVCWDDPISNTFSYKGNRWELETSKIDPTYLHVRLDLITKSSLTAITAQIRCEDDPHELCYKNVFANSGEYMAATFSCDYEGNWLDKDIKLEIQLVPKVPEPAVEVLQWFESETFGDITIVAADGKKCRCHRDILARCSEVLKLKFNSGVEGAKKNVVNIDGYKGKVVAQLLSFIYTNECGNIGPIATRLYAAAKEFQLAGLKVLCESAMAANLSAQSIVKTFKLATDENLDDLLAKCVEFADSHKAELPVGDLLVEALKVGAEPNAKRARKE